MRLNHYQYVIRNKNLFLYDNATGTGSDLTNDPGAYMRDPNRYLAPHIGTGGVTAMIQLVAAVLSIVCSIILISKFVK